MNAFVESVLRSCAMSAEDIRFSKTFETGDKTQRAKMLKAMFSAFNGGIVALVAVQSEWRVAYADLREELDNQLLASLLKSYNDFYTVNSKVPFSKKHMEEYVKHTPKDVERMLQGYFNRDA